MVEHFDALEADFQACYGLDLRHALREVGMRRLWALVKGLGPDSALARVLLTEPQPATQSEMAGFFAGSVVVSGGEA